MIIARMTNLTSLLVALLVGALAAGCGEGFEDGADELMQDELPQGEQQSVDGEQDSPSRRGRAIRRG